MPVRMPPLDAEDLEHVEDKWLDDAYEKKLLLSGDDLMWIENASNIVKLVLGESENRISYNRH